MTPLSTCWLLIELYVIPHGYLKWYFLSFYIQPFLLALCQLYLWIKVLQKFLLTFILLVYKSSCFLISYVTRFRKFCLLFFKKYVLPNGKNHHILIEEVEEFFDVIPDNEYQNEIVLYTSLNMRRSSSNSNGTVHLNMRNKSHDNMIYAYDFQTRVSQMFAKDHEVSAFIEPNQGEFMELGEHEEDPSDVLVDSCSVISSVDEKMNLLDNYNAVPLFRGPILSETELELEFSLLSPVSSLSPGINGPALEEYFPSPNMSSPLDYGTLNQNFPSVNSYTTGMVMDQQLVHEYTSCADEEVDLLYNKYAERMSWFDVLNHERLCALSAVLRKHLSSPNSFEFEMEPTSLPVQYISLSRVARKRLVRSLESDLELVYVAQSCLSWEILHHQYKKVEALCCSTSKNGIFCGNITAKFQKFQILLERFVEDDSCGGKRHLNYAHTRFSQKNLLQVPQVSGYVESNERVNGETSKPIEVLKAIEKCIHAFWFYVKTDCKKKKKFLWSQPRVEDPRDILLLHDLNKKLQMKELWLKDVKGKRNCWLRRAIKPQQEEYSKIDFVLTLIDMELVSRILHMSIISTSHFKWCQQKLNNIQFKDGHILRTPITLPLFPS
ncbi:putative structural maintenance of chromosomes protein 4-like [Capsicum annuum]|nr:putative structural maintenance of chromosomes protein 4-like [Capsicum annuum]